MEAEDEVTVRMLQNLIENIRAGHIKTVDRSGDSDGDTVWLEMTFIGDPKIKPTHSPIGG